MVRPADRQALSYQVLKAALVAVDYREDEATMVSAKRRPNSSGSQSIRSGGDRTEGTLYGRKAIGAAVMSGTGPRVHVLAGMAARERAAWPWRSPGSRSRPDGRSGGCRWSGSARICGSG